MGKKQKKQGAPAEKISLDAAVVVSELGGTVTGKRRVESDTEGDSVWLNNLFFTDYPQLRFDWLVLRFAHSCSRLRLFVWCRMRLHLTTYLI